MSFVVSRWFACWSVVSISLLLTACGGSSHSICKWADECGDLGMDVDECVERIEDGIDDEHFDREEVVECEQCLNDQGDDCDDGWRECLDECGDVVVEVSLDL